MYDTQGKKKFCSFDIVAAVIKGAFHLCFSQIHSVMVCNRVTVGWSVFYSRRKVFWEHLLRKCIEINDMSIYSFHYYLERISVPRFVSVLAGKTYASL